MNNKRRKNKNKIIIEDAKEIRKLDILQTIITAAHNTVRGVTETQNVNWKLFRLVNSSIGSMIRSYIVVSSAICKILDIFRLQTEKIALHTLLFRFQQQKKKYQFARQNRINKIIIQKKKIMF